MSNILYFKQAARENTGAKMYRRIVINDAFLWRYNNNAIVFSNPQRGMGEFYSIISYVDLVFFKIIVNDNTQVLSPYSTVESDCWLHKHQVLQKHKKKKVKETLTYINWMLML